jgi:hypothetical protein
MKNLKKIILFVLLGANFFATLKPVSEKNAKLIGVGVGIGAVCLTSSLAWLALYGSGFKYTQDEQGVKTWIKPAKSSKVIAAGTVLASSIIAGYLSYKKMQEYTPETKFGLALEIIERIEKDSIAIKEFETHAAFLTFIMSEYESKWPLVSAVNSLERYVQDLKFIKKHYLDKAFGMAEKYKQQDLLIKINNLYKRLEKLMEYCTVRLSLIKSWPMYNEQYEKYGETQKIISERAQFIQEMEYKIREIVRQELSRNAQANTFGYRN